MLWVESSRQMLSKNVGQNLSYAYTAEDKILDFNGEQIILIILL